MAINEQAFHPQAPAFARSNPAAYYAWLTSNGFPHRAAYDQTTGIFGPPKPPEQQQKDAARANQQAGFAQAGGAIGGVIAGTYVMNNAGDWINRLTGQKVSEEVVKNAATQFTGMPGSEATQTAWNAGADAATTATPQVISTEGGMSTVQTPVGPQQVPTESLNDSGFWQSIDWGRAAQGGVGALQLYGAYKALKSGDKIGAGLMGATGALNVASAAGANLGETVGGAVIPGLNVATGLYTGYKTAEALSDAAAGRQRDVMGVTGGAAAGAGIGSAILPGIGTAIGAAIGAAAGYAGSRFGSSKKKPQMMRDSIRGVLQEQGILDENYMGTLADGSTYDFGKDGSTLKWKNIDKIAEAQPTAWGAAVPGADAIAAAYGFVGQKASDIAIMYAKGAVSNAGDNPDIARANVQHFAKQQGLTPQMIQGKLDEALADNRINQSKYNYYMDGVNQLFGDQTAPQAAPIPRPEKGQVARQSAGLYRNDKGQLIAAKSMRQALERAYGKTKDNKKEKEL